MRFLKVILPPLVAFAVFTALIKYNPLQNHFEGLADIGNGTAAGLINYYEIFAPFQFVVAILTQYLVILPLWDRILTAHRTAFSIFAGMILICVILAGAIAYIIWDSATGTEHWLHITLFMAGVQILYWAINFLTLALLDWSRLQKSGKANTDSKAGSRSDK